MDIDKYPSLATLNKRNLKWLAQLPEDAWQHRYHCRCGGRVEYKGLFDHNCSCL